MAKLFISHSSPDDPFVRDLRAALADHGQDGWIDSRELCGGGPLWSEIQQAIDDAAGFAVVVSTAALQSKWVGKELKHAIKVQRRKTKAGEPFPVVPLLLDGTKLGALEEHFGEEPVCIPVSSEPGGIDDAVSRILTAFGQRLPADQPTRPQPKAEPLEELVLELTDLRFDELDGVRRASARAWLVYEPATPGSRNVRSKESWRLVAPIGPIEAEEIRWYLEKYAIWPSSYFDDRAANVKRNLVEWGKLLHAAAMPPEHVANVMKAWARIDSHAGRRFSVYVDRALEAGADDDQQNTVKEVETLLLGLPWELLHDGDDFLFQGAQPTRVRRRLPNTRVMDVPVVDPPIRILLVTSRPEDEACLYIDHRASALPLVETMERLGDRVRVHVLGQPTLSGLRNELDRARQDRQPYHVVHFDGHGVYDRRVGLGGLCFELAADADKLENRRHETIYTDELGSLLKDHRIPLVFLEACQTATAEESSESVASELLTRGVASVVAMSHSVLVETARRFVESFYRSLADGSRVGDAMLAGQRALKDDTFRGRIFGEGEFHLDDWFVPVLYHEKDDPQLFTTAVQPQTLEDLQAALKARLGDVPLPPETGFVGRSRELLALERLLRELTALAAGSGAGKFAAPAASAVGSQRYAVIRGQGGEGKTALATELARWMVRSRQVRRAAFVSVEMHTNVAAVLDAIGSQLVPGYSVATLDLEQAMQRVEQTLREQSVLLVVDNMESIRLAFCWARAP